MRFDPDKAKVAESEMHPTDRSLPVDVILDGEIVALDSEGHPSFQALQHRRTSALSVVYYAFDLLDLEGESLLRKPLDERRRRLKTVVRDSHVLLSDVLPGSPQHIEREIRKLRLEGVVAKRADRPYVAGRGRDWIKVKRQRPVDCVLVGLAGELATPKLVLALRHADGRLHHFAVKL